MSELGALLELIHDAHSQLTTFEAEYRDWIRPRPSLELYVERTQLGEPRAHWRGAGPFPQAVATTRRIWLTAPDCVRVEVVHRDELVRLSVVTGERWWDWNCDQGAIYGEPSADRRAGGTFPPPHLIPPLVNPAAVLATLRLQPVGTAVRIGREVVTALAALRRPSHTARPVRYELEFDAQHGTILRRAALDGDELVCVTEAMAIQYDRPIDRRRFVFASPDGQPARLVRPPAAVRHADPRSGGASDLRAADWRAVAGPPIHHGASTGQTLS